MRDEITKLVHSINVDNLQSVMFKSGLLNKYTVDKKAVNVDWSLNFPCRLHREAIISAIQTQLLSNLEFESVDVNLGHNISKTSQDNRVPHVKHIIGVSSSKGGVGKTTTSINLAHSLSMEGARVGLLDADVYGPSIPQMLGIDEDMKTSNNKFIPSIKNNLQVVSMGFFMEKNKPIAWRSPMVIKALQQLIFDTMWDKLDYLIIDFPPGTGDVALTICQKVPLSGMVIVTTPQNIAVEEAAKSIGLYKKFSIPILGLVENMSGFVCSCCGHYEKIFGEDGGKNLAEINSIDFLGKIPLLTEIQSSLDNGSTMILDEKNHKVRNIYINIANHISAKVGLKLLTKKSININYNF